MSLRTASLLATTLLVAACASSAGDRVSSGTPALRIPAAAAMPTASVPAVLPASAQPVMNPSELVPVSTPPMPRTAPAQTAINLARQYMDNRAAQPTLGADGHVVYRLGESVPTITCAPERECLIQLEPGERMADAGDPVHLSDKVRWAVSPLVSGTGPSRTISIVVKPSEPNISADLVIATDRRTYYLRLHSDPHAYTPITTFAYPGDQQAQWEQLRAAAVKDHADTVATMPNISIDNLHFAYHISGDAPFAPVRVFDDGAKTYIQLPASVKHSSAPGLVIDGPAGAQLVNYRQRGDYLIVDKIFDKASLLLGVGDAQQRVDITRAAS